MGRIIEKELNDLKDKLLRIGALVETQLDRSIKSLVE